MSELTSHAARPAADRVLIVPHCFLCGALLQRLLSRSGYHVEVVRGGDAAVCRALEALPQAVLVDLNLSDDDGWKVGRRLRAGLGSAVRLIGFAPGAWEGDPVGWAEAGFDGWLKKPVNADRLFDLLTAARRAEPVAPAERPRG